MRTVDVATTSRADYGIYLPVLRRLQSQADVRVRVLVSGSHLSADFGLSGQTIEADGFEIAARIPVLESSDTPGATARAVSRGVAGFAEHFVRQAPDILVVLGDRFEMHAAALAALPFRIPVAHIHGGEVTAGAFDDALRHSMTKLSHLHFVSTESYARRVRQLGEEAWRVTVSGAPSLDNLRTMSLWDRAEISARVGLRVPDRFLLVTFHPATLDPGDPAAQAQALFVAIERLGLECVVTMPNADPGGQAVRGVIRSHVAGGGSVQAVENLGTQGYFSLMALASAMAGNSSSGIVEAASFGLPVVNVGSRQDGRVRGENVIDVGSTTEAIVSGLQTALTPAFRVQIQGMTNPYGDGRASERIVDRLASIDLNPALLMKRFVDTGTGRP